ncbi:hypothetical protein QBC46DRAFT_336459 [Diplogelasinospora grovesii]|uniref:Uncharacterized protein n=1 Tax=Diplogelasinospora grovesii TaxID=303347 RepID=A0AAN6SA64_9PEZI|nr:hypothetical protein QBC46DRAFT_336459 [Diplogelasinospora grovesii]
MSLVLLDPVTPTPQLYHLLAILSTYDWDGVGQTGALKDGKSAKTRWRQIRKKYELNELPAASGLMEYLNSITDKDAKIITRGQDEKASRLKPPMMTPQEIGGILPSSAANINYRNIAARAAINELTGELNMERDIASDGEYFPSDEDSEDDDDMPGMDRGFARALKSAEFIPSYDKATIHNVAKHMFRSPALAKAINEELYIKLKAEAACIRAERFNQFVIKGLGFNRATNLRATIHERMAKTDCYAQEEEELKGARMSAPSPGGKRSRTTATSTMVFPGNLAMDIVHGNSVHRAEVSDSSTSSPGAFDIATRANPTLPKKAPSPQPETRGKRPTEESADDDTNDGEDGKVI